MKNPLSSETERAISLARSMKKSARAKSVLFVDLPKLANGVRFDLYDIFRNLGREFDEIRTYAKIPKEPQEERDIWGFLRVATNAGAYPALYPSDVDPFLVDDLRKTMERSDVGEVAILTGDNGFSEVLRSAKRVGIRTKVIVPPEGNTYLLRSIADETKTFDDYGQRLIPGSSERRSDSFQIAAMREENEVSAVIAHAPSQFPEKGYFRAEGGDRNE